MTRAELAAMGLSIYGDRWQSALARDLDMSVRHMQRLAAGSEPITEGVAADIREIAARHQAHRALDLIADLAKEQGGMPATIALTQGRDAVGRQATKLLAEALGALGVTVEINPASDAMTGPAARAAAAAAAKK